MAKKRESTATSGRLYVRQGSKSVTPNIRPALTSPKHLGTQPDIEDGKTAKGKHVVTNILTLG